MSKYYIVDSAILPHVMDKVIEARQMLENGTVRQVSEAVKRVGISRGTYYKYKDYVFPAVQGKEQRKAVISMMLHDWASVVLSFDISEMQIGLDELLRMLKKIKGLANVQLIAVE